MIKGQILVTGGTGYIGSHTVVELIQSKKYEVVVVDNLSNSNISVLDGIEYITGLRPTFYELDCNDLSAMREIFERHGGFDGVIHFAASKAVGESVKEPIMYYRNNITSLLTILELISQYDTKGLVFSSSCTVYGQPKQLPVTEEADVLPALSPYGNTKQICEEIITDVIHSGVSFGAILLRYFNPIGAHPSAKIGELPIGVPQNLVPYLTQTAAGIRDELVVFGDDYDTPDGSCIRDYIHVVDLAKAHVTALDRLLLAKCAENIEIYNIGTGKGVSVLELINTFQRATGVSVPYRIGARREGDIEKVWADPSKANENMGWKATSTLEETLLSAWNWQKNIYMK